MSKFRSSRHHREILLADWRDAEELAAWYMREELGLNGARITGSGNDRGIDVVAEGAVAQVKHVNAPIGAPLVQAALGAGHGRDAAMFFALSGYTRQAEDFAGRAGVRLFQYDIYGEVRAVNEPAQQMVANHKNADADADAVSIQDVRMNELRAKAAPALSRLKGARDKVLALARTLEGTAGLETDNPTLAFILGEYASFFAEPGGYGAVGGYDEAFKMIETARAEQVQGSRGGGERYSKDAVEAGFADLIKLHAELEDVDKLRPMSAAQWVRQLFDWDVRRQRIKYLTQYARYRSMEDEPSLEAFELKAIMDMNIGGKFNYSVADRWLRRPFAKAPDDLAIYFAAAQKDPINFGTDYCLGLFENFRGMDFDDDDGHLPAYPLGWSVDEIDRLHRMGF